MGMSTASLGRIMINFSVLTDSADRNLASFSQRISSVGIATAKVSTAFMMLGSTIGPVFDKMNRQSIAAVKSAIAFQTQMNRVTTIMESQTRAMDKYGVKLREISRLYGIELPDAANALYKAISAGIPEKYATDALAVSAKLARVGMTDLTTAMDAVRTTMNAYGVQAGKASKWTNGLSDATSQYNFVAQKLFQIVDYGVVTLDKLPAVLGKVMPIARTAGISIEELGSAFAGATRNGLEARVAGTSLMNLIMSFVKPTNKAKEAVAALNKKMRLSGSDAIELSSAFLRRNGLIKAMKMLNDAAQGNVDIITQIISRRRAFRFYAAGMTDNFRNMEQALLETTEAATNIDDKFMEMQDTTFRLARASATFNTVLQKLGSTQLPLVDKGLTRVIKKLTEVSDWVDSHETLGGVFGTFYASVGLAGSAVSRLATAFGTLGFAMLGFKMIGGMDILAMFVALPLHIAKTSKTLRLLYSALKSSGRALGIYGGNFSRLAKEGKILRTVFRGLTKDYSAYVARLVEEGKLGRTIAETGSMRFKNMLKRKKLLAEISAIQARSVGIARRYDAAYEAMRAAYERYRVSLVNVSIMRSKEIYTATKLNKLRALGAKRLGEIENRYNQVGKQVAFRIKGMLAEIDAIKKFRKWQRSLTPIGGRIPGSIAGYKESLGKMRSVRKAIAQTTKEFATFRNATVEAFAKFNRVFSSTVIANKRAREFLKENVLLAKKAKEQYIALAKEVGVHLSYTEKNAVALASAKKQLDAIVEVSSRWRVVGRAIKETVVSILEGLRGIPAAILYDTVKFSVIMEGLSNIYNIISDTIGLFRDISNIETGLTSIKKHYSAIIEELESMGVHLTTAERKQIDLALAAGYTADLMLPVVGLMEDVAIAFENIPQSIAYGMDGAFAAIVEGVQSMIDMLLPGKLGTAILGSLSTSIRQRQQSTADWIFNQKPGETALSLQRKREELERKQAYRDRVQSLVESAGKSAKYEQVAEQYKQFSGGATISNDIREQIKNLRQYGIDGPRAIAFVASVQDLTKESRKAAYSVLEEAKDNSAKLNQILKQNFAWLEHLRVFGGAVITANRENLDAFNDYARSLKIPDVPSIDAFRKVLFYAEATGASLTDVAAVLRSNNWADIMADQFVALSNGTATFSSEHSAFLAKVVSGELEAQNAYTENTAEQLATRLSLQEDYGTSLGGVMEATQTGAAAAKTAYNDMVTGDGGIEYSTGIAQASASSLGAYFEETLPTSVRTGLSTVVATAEQRYRDLGAGLARIMDTLGTNMNLLYRTKFENYLAVLVSKHAEVGTKLIDLSKSDLEKLSELIPSMVSGSYEDFSIQLGAALGLGIQNTADIIDSPETKSKITTSLEDLSTVGPIGGAKMGSGFVVKFADTVVAGIAELEKGLGLDPTKPDSWTNKMIASRDAMNEAVNPSSTAAWPAFGTAAGYLVRGKAGAAAGYAIGQVAAGTKDILDIRDKLWLSVTARSEQQLLTDLQGRKQQYPGTAESGLLTRQFRALSDKYGLFLPTDIKYALNAAKTAALFDRDNKQKQEKLYDLEKMQLILSRLSEIDPSAKDTLFQFLRSRNFSNLTDYSYAQGTQAHPGGVALVGEEGPELVNLPRGAQVYSNKETKAFGKLLGGIPSYADGTGSGSLYYPDYYGVDPNNPLGADFFGGVLGNNLIPNSAYYAKLLSNFYEMGMYGYDPINKSFGMGALTSTGPGSSIDEIERVREFNKWYNKHRVPWKREKKLDERSKWILKDRARTQDLNDFEAWLASKYANSAASSGDYFPPITSGSNRRNPEDMSWGEYVTGGGRGKGNKLIGGGLSSGAAYNGALSTIPFASAAGIYYGDTYDDYKFSNVGILTDVREKFAKTRSDMIKNVKGENSPYFDSILPVTSGQFYITPRHGKVWQQWAAKYDKEQLLWKQRNQAYGWWGQYVNTVLHGAKGWSAADLDREWEAFRDYYEDTFSWYTDSPETLYPDDLVLGYKKKDAPESKDKAESSAGTGGERSSRRKSRPMWRVDRPLWQERKPKVQLGPWSRDGVQFRNQDVYGNSFSMDGDVVYSWDGGIWKRTPDGWVGQYKTVDKEGNESTYVEGPLNETQFDNFRRRLDPNAKPLFGSQGVVGALEVTNIIDPKRGDFSSSWTNDKMTSFSGNPRTTFEKYFPNRTVPGYKLASAAMRAFGVAESIASSYGYSAQAFPYSMHVGKNFITGKTEYNPSSAISGISDKELTAFYLAYKEFLSLFGGALTAAGMHSNGGVDGRNKYNFGMASGGTLKRANRVLVGEEGPEVVDLPAGATVTANEDLLDPTRSFASEVMRGSKPIEPYIGRKRNVRGPIAGYDRNAINAAVMQAMTPTSSVNAFAGVGIDSALSAEDASSLGKSSDGAVVQNIYNQVRSDADIRMIVEDVIKKTTRRNRRG